jgi:hypothetical protein
MMAITASITNSTAINAAPRRFVVGRAAFMGRTSANVFCDGIFMGPS